MSSFFRYPGGKEKLSDIIVSKLISMTSTVSTTKQDFFKEPKELELIEYREPFLVVVQLELNSFLNIKT